MNFKTILDLAGLFLIPFFVVLIPTLIGHRFGIYRIKDQDELQHAPVGTIVGSAFALLAFMLAFTFQIATNRYDARKELLLDEVTNIRTTYLRAGLLKEPMRSDAKKLLIEYIDIRADLARDTTALNSTLLRSQQILNNLWDYAEELADEDRSSEVYALFTQSVNDLFDNFNQRITMTFEYRIPPLVIWILMIIAFFTMFTIGYQFGISGKGSFRINVFLAIIFGVVMFLISSLDRPEKGLARLNQKPVMSLEKQMHEMQLNDSQKIQAGKSIDKIPNLGD
jgi:ABC-type multidrug transport system fused ATPase/permease subunit